MIEYPPSTDSKGYPLDYYIDYLVTIDGTFIVPDLDDIYDFLLKENDPLEISTKEGLFKVLKRECKTGVTAVYHDCDFYWKKISVNKVLYFANLEDKNGNIR